MFPGATGHEAEGASHLPENHSTDALQMDGKDKNNPALADEMLQMIAAMMPASASGRDALWLHADGS